MGANVEIVQDLHRMRPENSEVERLWAGTELAKERFDWNPVHGGLEGFKKGLKKTADWFCKPENLKLTNQLGITNEFDVMSRQSETSTRT